MDFIAQKDYIVFWICVLHFAFEYVLSLFYELVCTYMPIYRYMYLYLCI